MDKEYPKDETYDQPESDVEICHIFFCETKLYYKMDKLPIKLWFFASHFSGSHSVAQHFLKLNRKPAIKCINSFIGFISMKLISLIIKI